MEVRLAQGDERVVESSKSELVEDEQLAGDEIRVMGEELVEDELVDEEQSCSKRSSTLISYRNDSASDVMVDCDEDNGANKLESPKGVIGDTDKLTNHWSCSQSSSFSGVLV